MYKLLFILFIIKLYAQINIFKIWFKVIHTIMFFTRSQNLRQGYNNSRVYLDAVSTWITFLMKCSLNFWKIEVVEISATSKIPYISHYFVGLFWQFFQFLIFLKSALSSMKVIAISQRFWTVRKPIEEGTAIRLYRWSISGLQIR